MDGVSVIRTAVYAAPNAGFVRRLLDHLSFTVSSVFATAAVRSADVVITECPPLFTGLAGLFISKMIGARHVFHVADLWPDSAVALGALRDRRIITAASWLAHFIYRHTDLITVSANGQRDRLIAQGVPADKIVHLANGVDVRRFEPARADGSFRRANGLDGEFVVLYHGTHGAAHGLDTVLDAARRLLDDREGTQVRFVLMGGGAERQRLVDRKEREGISNVIFVEPVPREQMPAILNEIDVGLVHLRRVPVFEGVQPSKLFEFMATARPVLLAVAGEARAIVERAECGVCVTPESADELAAAVQEMKRAPDRLRAMGENGRRYVERFFSRDVLARSWDETLRQVVES